MAKAEYRFQILGLNPSNFYSQLPSASFDVDTYSKVISSYYAIVHSLTDNTTIDPIIANIKNRQILPPPNVVKKYMRILLTVSCLYYTLSCIAQTYSDLAKEKPCQTCLNYNPVWQNLFHYNAADINRVFQSIKDFGIEFRYPFGIEFRYPQGRCQNRAQIMSMMLSSLKISHTRVWLFAPIDLDPKDKTQLQITDKNELTKDNTIKWNYHVAPCVLVDNGSKTDTVVPDPRIDKNYPLNLPD